MKTLNNMQNTDKAISAMKIITIAALAFGVLSTSFNTYFFYVITNSIWVRGEEGEYFKVGRQDAVSASERREDYTMQVERVVTLLYELDEGNYDKNTEDVLFLMGESGKEILKEYDAEGLKNFLIANNARSIVDSIHVQLDMGTYPEPNAAKGVVKFKQTFIKNGVKKSRYGESEFTIYDVTRWDKNREGAKIDYFKPTFYEK